ncbi:MAG: head-tail connector protein [Hyphomicrobiaceae bacterium]|nr:head-tail connector protein [Hyphomicrobiaceae bacterium]
MALVLTSGPAVEPVSLGDVKAHLRIDGTDEDLYLGGIILTSRLQIEAALGLGLITQSWRLTLSSWPAGRVLPLPIRPVTAINGIATLDAAGTATPLPTAGVRLDTGPPPVVIAPLTGWPSLPPDMTRIAIDFTAGYGATPSTVPAPIRHGLLLLSAHWYEHRDPLEHGTTAAIPHTISDLLLPYRSPRL